MLSALDPLRVEEERVLPHLLQGEVVAVDVAQAPADDVVQLLVGEATE